MYFPISNRIRKAKNKKSQVMFPILLLLGMVLIVGGYIFLKISHEKKESETVIQTITETSTAEKSYRTTFFRDDLDTCLNDLIDEAISYSFGEILKDKSLGSVEGFPLVLEGKDKVNIGFDDLKTYIEDYVNKKFWKCKNKVFDYTKTKGYYVLLDLVDFSVFRNKWKAKINYEIHSIVNKKVQVNSLDFEGSMKKLDDLLELYNGLINYEFENRAITSNLFAMIYGVYSNYFGYPTSNVIIPCEKIVFDLNKAKEDIKKVISIIVPKYKVYLTDNGDTESVYLIKYLDHYIPHTEINFYPLLKDVQIDFSVVDGSSAYIRDNKLYVEPSYLNNPFGALSKDMPNECSYDLFYDLRVPILVSLKFEKKTFNFVMDLVVNNNFATNKTWEEAIADNSNNEEPKLAKSKSCPFDFEEGVKIKVLDLNNNPIENAYVTFESSKYSCYSKTNDKGEAKLPINCVNCKVFANKEGYIGSYKLYEGQNTLVLNLFNLKTVHFWTIYTPKWLIDNWGNNSFENLRFQGNSLNTKNFENTNSDLVKTFTLEAQQNLIKDYKEIPLTFKLDSPQGIIINNDKITPLATSVDLANKVPYSLYEITVNESGDFVKRYLGTTYVFGKNNYYFDDLNNKFKECVVKIYEFKGNLDGTKVYLIRLSNNKVIEFPYYNTVFTSTADLANSKGFVSHKYLVFCLPSGVSIESNVLIYNQNEDGKWNKIGSVSFNSVFKEVRQ
jgi:hypothetical protein